MPLDQRLISRKQGEVDTIRLALRERNKVNSKKELVKRLTHIQHLARQQNYAEIERLLQQGYV